VSRLVLVTEDELEVGVITMELARLTGNAKPKPERMAAAAALEQKLAAALERDPDAPPLLEQVEAAIDVLIRAGALGPAVGETSDAAAELAERFRAMGVALEFYADLDTYERLRAGDRRPSGVGVGDPAVMIDRGACARRALRTGGRP
jgi:hypothetical protein